MAATSRVACVRIPRFPIGAVQLAQGPLADVPDADAHWDARPIALFENTTKAATFVPMLCAEWQMQNDPENGKSPTDSDMFRHDGKFVANPKVPGSWTTVSLVKTIEEFNPQVKTSVGSMPS